MCKVNLTRQPREAEMGAGTDGIEIKFIPSLDRPVEPEEMERILAEKDPSLVKYFGIGATKPDSEHSLPSPAEGGKEAK